MKRKILAIIMVCIMVLCVTVQAQNNEFSQLQELKILNGDLEGNLNLDKPVTRAELMQFAVNSLNLRSVTANYNGVVFQDMEGHWGKNAVNLAVEMKLIEKSDNFNPEGTVTMAEAIKTVVKILGYEPMAKSSGGEPMGYIITASSIGLTQGMTVTAEQTALRRDVVQLLSTALRTPVMQQVKFGETEEFKIADGKDGEMKVTLSSLFE